MCCKLGFGRNNETRLLYLAVGNYCDAEWLSKLEVPKDEDYIIAAIHSYCQMEDSRNIGESFNYRTETDKMFEMIREFTEQTGVPVIIGETAVTHREDYYDSPDAFWLYDKKNKVWREDILMNAINCRKYL